jgi:2,3-bisphosphoglycerate-dependent phosphoglycerate mutase
MKHTFLSVFLIVMTFNSFSQEKNQETSSDATTYYFIRHAEKDRSNPTEKNPHLTEEGLKRADNWSNILGNVKFDSVYSTEYHRTIETAKPTADKNKLDITIYDPNNLNNVDDFIKDTKGKTVLVVGHSNTTPAFVNVILGKRKYEDIDDRNNGNLYIITIIGDKMVDQVLTIN